MLKTAMLEKILDASDLQLATREDSKQQQTNRSIPLSLLQYRSRMLQTWPR